MSSKLVPVRRAFTLAELLVVIAIIGIDMFIFAAAATIAGQEAVQLPD